MSGTAVCPTCGAPVGADARFCASCGAQLGPALPEERKLATIVFADVTGSTDLGGQLDPERVRALLRDYFRAMSAIVATWGGTVEKYIGDAILAVWGVPTAREDDPVRALHAATEILAELERLNETFEARHGVRLRIRIGVNTGEVIAPLGSRPGGQFLVSGDAVNVAAKLQQSAEPGTVLVGERTWSSARHAFDFGDPVPVEIRGKDEPITARLLGEALHGEAQRTPFQAPMIGRDRELNTLVGLLDEAIESATPRLVVVAGPAGIGKSRLLRETIAEAGERFDKLLVLRGRCLAAGHGITFWALGEILRSACSISLDEPADSAAQKLEYSVAGPLAQIGLSVEEIVETVAALATSANITLPDNPIADYDPEQVYALMSRAWPRYLTALARTWPLAVMVEDIHWADERLLSMLEMLASRTAGAMLLVATARPEFLDGHPGFGAGQDLSIVSLRPLTGAQSDRLIDELLDSADLPEALVDEMRAKADGNPFFIEEMLQRLVDEGALVREGERWQATERTAGVQLSDSVHGLLAARIDALPVHEKQFLQEASVVGRIFWPGALAQSAGPGATDPAAAEEVLHSLERKGLISGRPTSTIETQAEYMFRHVLIHDVAYASVPKARRARAHAEIGRWIEDLAGDRIDEFGELIAYHYQAAVSADDADLAWSETPTQREEIRARAFAMLLRAGRSARHRFAIDKAIELHDAALTVAAGEADLSTAHEELADDHEALFRGDEAVAEYLLAIDHADGAPGSAERIARLTAKAARMAIRYGTFRESPPFERIQQLIEASLAADVADEVRAPLLIASAGLVRGPNGAPIGTGRVVIATEQMPDLEERVAAVREGLAIARRLHDPGLQYMAYDLLAIVFQSSGQEQRYREAAEEALELLDQLPSRRQQVDLLVSVAGARADAGRYEQAIEAAEDALTRSDELSPHERMHAVWEIYRAAEPLGRWDRIEELMPWYAEASSAEGEITCAAVRAGPALGATVIARRGGTQRAAELVPAELLSGTGGTFGSAAFAARYAATVGATDKAEEVIDASLGRTESGFLATGAAPMIDALLELGAFARLSEFVPVARGLVATNRLIAPTAARAEAALLLHAKARPDDDDARSRAEELLRSALDGFEQLDAPFEVARTAERLAAIVQVNQREELLVRARELYEDLRATPFANRLRAASLTSAASASPSSTEPLAR